MLFWDGITIERKELIMARQFRSDDSPYRWLYGFGYGTYDATFGTEAMSWNGSTRFGAYGSITGTAGQTSFVKPVGWGHAGFCLLHQTRGSGAGAWELAYVDFSGASAVSDKPLQNSYGAGAQVVTLSNGRTGGYNNVTISGTLTPPAWNGSTGGIIAIMARGTVTVNGAINVSGGGGASNVQSASGGGTGGGFYGGNCTTNGNLPTGEGYAGGSITTGWTSTTTYGNAGTSGFGSGGGGGNATVGGQATQGSTPAGYGGLTSGNAGLTSMVFGGGGGGSYTRGASDRNAGGGGAGGGNILILSPTIVVGGYLYSNGGAGGSGTTTDWDHEPCGAGGGGAGGSILLKCKTATLGSNRILAAGGSGGTNVQRAGGAGGSGRIHLDYSTSYSGSTSPTIDVRQDTYIQQPALLGGVI